MSIPGLRLPTRGATPLVRKLWRYGAGSLVATACSEVAFLALYGAVGTSTTTASVIGWLAGAVPNYWLNRTWTWGRRGRPSLRRELLPYIAVVLVTLTLAVGATSLADRVLAGTTLSATARSLLVGAVFLGVYVVVFALRFLLLDRLFAEPTQPTHDTQTTQTTQDTQSDPSTRTPTTRTNP